MSLVVPCVLVYLVPRVSKSNFQLEWILALISLEFSYQCRKQKKKNVLDGGTAVETSVPTDLPHSRA